MPRCLWTSLLFVLVTSNLRAADEPNYTRKEDVIYGRKFGMALTLDVFTPKKDPNGAGIVFCVSGGFFSDKRAIMPFFFHEYFDRGYTVFAVVHGSQPKFTIPEVLEDMHRAVRFVRYHAKDYGIDPDRIGITGGSAGGHLSLMLGSTGKEGNPKSVDPVDRASSKVQAVACFFPPTDFLNYGKDGEVALGTDTLKAFKAPFDFTELDPITHAFTPVLDEGRRRAIGKQISPVYQVTEQSAPTLIIHGDADTLVPIQQSERMIEKLKEAKVPCELIVKKGAVHAWAGMDKDLKLFADWFDKYLLKK
jgi:acetyl esterase/lipase